MAAFGTVQLIGGVNNTVAEVELNNLAARLNVRPTDIERQGSYSHGFRQTLCTALTSGSYSGCYGFWLGTMDQTTTEGSVRLGPSICAIKKATAFWSTQAMGTGSLGIYSVGLKIRRGTPKKEDNGGSSTVNLVGAQLRSQQQISNLVFFGGQETTGAMAAIIASDDSFPDTQYLTRMTGSMRLVAGNRFGPIELWDSEETGYPIVLEAAMSLGVEIQTPTFSAATGISLGLNLCWDEYKLSSDYY